MDVSLYGHLTFDRIFEDFRKYTAIGSIGNDTPGAVLSQKSPLLFNYFKQLLS